MRRTRSFVSFLLATALLAGCGGAPKEAASTNPANTAAQPTPSAQATTSEQATTPATANTPAVMEVTVGGTSKSSLKNLPLFLSGFGQKDGIKVNFKEYKGGSEVAKAVLNGEVDFAFMAATHVLKDKSGQMRALALITQGPGHALVIDSRYKDSIKSVKDLKGQKIGVSSLGSGPHTTLKTLLANQGMQESDVTVLPTGHDVLKAFAEEKVVAHVSIEPHISKAIESGAGVVLVDTRTAAGIETVYGTREMPWIVLGALDTTIADKAEATQRLVSALNRELQFIATSPADAILQRTPDFFMTEKNGGPELFAKILEGNKGGFSSDGMLTQSGMEAVWTSLQDSGAVPRDQALEFEAYVDIQFIQKATASAR